VAYSCYVAAEAALHVRSAGTVARRWPGHEIAFSCALMVEPRGSAPRR
jgi:hypothetical protein